MRLGGDPGYERAPQNEDVLECNTENPILVSASLCCLVVACLIAYISLGAVPPLTVAISYNHFSKVADTSTIYTPGRYFLGPVNKFLYFPSSVQTIEFTNEVKLIPNGQRYSPLHTRTKEGLGLHLQVSLQYRLIPEHVGQLYNEFNQNYEQVFISSVRDVLIKAASEYEATQLWQERHKFGDTMQSMVNKALERTYATCWGLQLMKIDLPDTFEQSIVSTQVQGQTRLRLEQEQITAKIRAETSVIKAEFDRMAKVILANGQGNYTLITQSAQATAQKRSVDAQTDVMQQIKELLQLGGSDLVLYQKYDALDELGDASVFFGFGTSSQVLVNGGGI